MIISMKEYSERVSVEIDGHGRAEKVTWPEAARMLDRAYTEEIAATLETIDKYVKDAQAGVVQTMNALDALKELKRNLEDRHLKTARVEREERKMDEETMRQIELLGEFYREKKQREKKEGSKDDRNEN